MTDEALSIVTTLPDGSTWSARFTFEQVRSALSARGFAVVPVLGTEPTAETTKLRSQLEASRYRNKQLRRIASDFAADRSRAYAALESHRDVLDAVQNWADHTAAGKTWAERLNAQGLLLNALHKAISASEPTGKAEADKTIGKGGSTGPVTAGHSPPVSGEVTAVESPEPTKPETAEAEPEAQGGAK